MAIHGGGWRGGSKDGYGRESARFAGHGFVVVSVAYRLSRPGEPSWPGAFEDVREAVRWTRRHADEFGIDPDRIAAMGASAGGHLASLLGTLPEDDGSTVSAVVDFFGPADLARMVADRPPIGPTVALFLGGSPEERPAAYRAASPTGHASPGDAPHLLIHGELDDLVPADQSEGLARALAGAGVRARTIRIAGAGHNFGLRVGGRDLLPEILAFLGETWEHDGRVLSTSGAARPFAARGSTGKVKRNSL